VCPCGAPGSVHRHGCYWRYEDPDILSERAERIQRYRHPACGRTFSVLPPHRLPYRLVRVERLEAYFDCRAGIQTQGLDPPPGVLEAGCLERAWSCLLARVEILKEAFGQLIWKPVSEATSLWKGLRQVINSVPKMLCFLSKHHFISLLANYLCLRPPD